MKALNTILFLIIGLMIGIYLSKLDNCRIEHQSASMTSLNGEKGFVSIEMEVCGKVEIKDVIFQTEPIKSEDHREI